MEHGLSPVDRAPLFRAPLIVSALPAEQGALRARLRPSRPRAGVWSALRNGRTLRGVVTGDGAIRARAGLQAALDRESASLVLVIGVGGGLSPALARGEAVEATRILDTEDPDFSAPTVELGVTARLGAVVTSPAIVDRARSKAALWHELGRPDAAVVDLESSVYARVAREYGIALAVLRIVSDTASEDLPPAIGASVSKDGSVRPVQVALRSVWKPSTWPELVRLKQRMDAASHRLADLVIEALDGGTLARTS